MAGALIILLLNIAEIPAALMLIIEYDEQYKAPDNYIPVVSMPADHRYSRIYANRALVFS